MSATSNEEIEAEILRRIARPGWVATRGLVTDPADAASSEKESIAIEAVMKAMAARGLVQLWKLVLYDGGDAILAAARPGFKLDEDLEQRGAWARAESYVNDE
ncbi:MAG: hypothetical protein ACP5M0_10490 [Desulfomonilaceae bacterium]